MPIKATFKAGLWVITAVVNGELQEFASKRWPQAMALLRRASAGGVCGMKKTREQIAAEKEAEQKEIDSIVQKLSAVLPKTPPLYRENGFSRRAEV